MTAQLLRFSDYEGQRRHHEPLTEAELEITTKIVTLPVIRIERSPTLPNPAMTERPFK